MGRPAQSSDPRPKVDLDLPLFQDLGVAIFPITLHRSLSEDDLACFKSWCPVISFSGDPIVRENDVGTCL